MANLEAVNVGLFLGTLGDIPGSNTIICTFLNRADTQNARKLIHGVRGALLTVMNPIIKTSENFSLSIGQGEEDTIELGFYVHPPAVLAETSSSLESPSFLIAMYPQEEGGHNYLHSPKPPKSIRKDPQSLGGIFWGAWREIKVNDPSTLRARVPASVRARYESSIKEG